MRATKHCRSIRLTDRIRDGAIETNRLTDVLNREDVRLTDRIRDGAIETSWVWQAMYMNSAAYRSDSRWRD